MIIRPAKLEDRSHIENIVRDAYTVYVSHIGREPGPMSDDYGALISAGQVFVAEEGSRVAGILVLKDEPGALLLDNVAVHPEAQGPGLRESPHSFRGAGSTPARPTRPSGCTPTRP